MHNSANPLLLYSKILSLLTGHVNHSVKPWPRPNNKTTTLHLSNYFPFFLLHMSYPSLLFQPQVGSYNDTQFLKLDITYQTSFTATCDAPRTDPKVDDCICLFPADLPSRFMRKDDGGRGLSVVYIGDIHQPHPTNPLACGAINTGNCFVFLHHLEK